MRWRNGPKSADGKSRRSERARRNGHLCFEIEAGSLSNHSKLRRKEMTDIAHGDRRRDGLPPTLVLQPFR
jgi:hypothetical protein